MKFCLDQDATYKMSVGNKGHYNLLEIKSTIKTEYTLIAFL